MVVPDQEKKKMGWQIESTCFSVQLDWLIQISTRSFIIQVFHHSCGVVVVPNQEKTKWVGNSRLASLSRELDWLIQHINMVFYNSSIRSKFWQDGSS
jgi:hypothetical protein